MVLVLTPPKGEPLQYAMVLNYQMINKKAECEALVMDCVWQDVWA